MSSTLGQITNFFTKAVSPLSTALSDIDRFKALLYRLGWRVDSIPDSYKTFIDSINELKMLLEELIADEQPGTAIELLKSLSDLIKSIGAINEAPPGIDAADINTYLQELKKDLLNLLLVDYLAAELPEIYKFSQLIGISETVNVPATTTRSEFGRIAFNLDRLPEIVKNPFSLSKFIYGWNTPSFRFNLLIQHLDDLLASMNIISYVELDDGRTLKSLDPSFQDFAPYKLVASFFLTYIGDTAVKINVEFLQLPSKGDALPGIALLATLPNDIENSFSIGTDLELKLSAENEEKVLLGVTVNPEKFSFVSPSESIPQSFQNDVGVSIEYNPDSPLFILGSADGSGLSIKSGAFSLKMLNDNGEIEIVMALDLKEINFKIKAGEGDGFIKKIIGDKEMGGSISLEPKWSNISGVNFSMSGKTSFNTPTHIDLGFISIQSLDIAIKSGDKNLICTVGADVKTSLGPLTAIIRSIGVKAMFSFPTDHSGNLGPLDLDIGFKPPTGIGLTVDAGGIKGGGILDFNPEKAEYFGALELEFKDLFSLKAFGILNTRMPDGSKDFSLLIIVTAEFSPVQLGFGFTLNGVGGMMGVNRTTKVEVLREGIKTNTLKSILFPEDIIANINRIVSDIKQVFPPQKDHFLICPMGKIGWGSPSIITLELGILIEIPATGFIILGVLKAIFPEEKDPLLKLQVNFLGIIDFENRSISFDASLYDSKILTFTLTGDMALRVSFGDKPTFILSVGGFHPAFKEVPEDLKSMRRITISLYDGEHARIIVQSYFAVTSNTAQFGAKAELYAEKGSFNIYGFVSYDVLFQFTPFKFVADFGASVALRRHSSVIMSIHVSGTLSGPKPWDAKGRASVSFFFFSISVPFHVTWGDSNNNAEKLKEDILKLLKDAIGENSNWKAEIPANSKLHVSIRSIPASEVVVHPFGIVSFSERIVPLEIDIKKFGNKLPKDANNFKVEINYPALGSTNEEIEEAKRKLSTIEAREQFAPANFFEISDSDKLSRPSFEPMRSGFKITGSEQLKAPPHIAEKDVDYEFSFLGKKRKPGAGKYQYPLGFFRANTKLAAASASSLSHQSNRVSVNAPAKLILREEQYAIANISDMKLHESNKIAASYTEALHAYNKLILEKPELKDQVQVLSVYELN